MFGFPKWVLAGSIGGLVGAAVWAGISYATNYEIGWIAWAIGFAVGFAVRFAAGENEEGVGPGLTAVVIAVLSILGGKYAAHSLLVSSVNIESLGMEVSQDHLIRSEADTIAEARIAAGRPFVSPTGKTLEDATEPADYPPELWQEAKAKWDGLPAADQQARLASYRQFVNSAMGELVAQEHSFADTFSLFDVLWFFLAAGTAYKLGAGNVGSDDD